MWKGDVWKNEKREGMIWLLIAIAWFLVGWLPSRIVKHHFVTCYGAVLGDLAWTRHNEWVEVVGALMGPLSILAPWLAMRARPDKSVPWGWKW